MDRTSPTDRFELDVLIESRTLPPSIEDALLASRETLRTTKAPYLKEADRLRR